ncbi:hypothetical protein GJ496_006833 [Pomphorhynchus laevis]|nr:hypothetical protein GJ496_006833 [Pomphorhynchus laevis]
METDMRQLNTLNTIRIDKDAPIIRLRINNKLINMEFGTSASVSILLKRICSKIEKPRLYPSHALKTYGGHVQDAIGSSKVMATLNERSQIVFNIEWPNFITYANSFEYNSKQLESIELIKSTLNNYDKIRDLLDCYSGLFEPSTTCVKNFEVKLTLNADAIPQCWGSRQIPFAIRVAVETELNRQLKLGIIEHVDTAHEHVD